MILTYQFRIKDSSWIVLKDDLMFFEHKHVHQLGWARAEADEIDLESEDVRPLIC